MSSVDGRSHGAVRIDSDVKARALLLWPGLDRKKLTRTCGDPRRVARLIERRTALSREAILGMLGVPPLRNEDRGRWTASSGGRVPPRPIAPPIGDLGGRRTPTSISGSHRAQGVAAQEEPKLATG